MPETITAAPPGATLDDILRHASDVTSCGPGLRAVIGFAQALGLALHADDYAPITPLLPRIAEAIQARREPALGQVVAAVQAWLAVTVIADADAPGRRNDIADLLYSIAGAHRRLCRAEHAGATTASVQAQAELVAVLASTAYRATRGAAPAAFAMIERLLGSATHTTTFLEAAQ